MGQHLNLNSRCIHIGQPVFQGSGQSGYRSGDTIPGHKLWMGKMFFKSNGLSCGHPDGPPRTNGYPLLKLSSSCKNCID
nr:hypothetical protein SHINE37_100339 [Rhizobiaceae bacterium]